MSWLYSFIFASLIFSAEGNLPFQSSSIHSAAETKQTIRLDETERFEQTYPLNLDGKVSVSNVNGSITIETWDSPQVKLEAVKTADSREKLTELEIQINAKQNYFQVEADYSNLSRNGKGWNNKLQVDFKLTVPKTAVLDEIETVNGSIYISNAANSTKASAVNGQIRATNLRGTANLSTVNGTVEADFDQLQTGGRISLDTVNGTVNLTMPSDVNATVKADTVNGSINNEFGLPVRKGKYVGKDLYGKIGSGDVQIKLSSVNGGLFVKRQKDGKNINPTTNLLPTKSNDDDDWEGFENGVNFPAVKPPKSPIAPMPPVFDGSVFDAQVQKEVSEALKAAQKELKKMTPEMQKEMEEALKNSKFDKREMEEQIKIAREKYREAMSNMSNISWTPKIERKSESFAIKGVPNLTIEAESSGVTVRGWDKPEIRYSVTRISNAPNQTPVNLKAEQNGQNLILKVADIENVMPLNEMNRVRIEVFVPKKSNLKIFTKGEIRLEGVSGEIDLNGSDGAINVRDSDGKMQIVSNDGNIRVIGFRGEIDAVSVDGTLALEGDFQKFSAQTADGNIILTLPNGANADIESNRKDINSDGISLKLNGNEKNFSSWKIGDGGVNHRLYATADDKFSCAPQTLSKRTEI